MDRSGELQSQVHDARLHLLPQRGDKPEWMHNPDYWAEKDQIPAIDLDEAAFVYR